ncbi:phenylalanine tRNA synthtetase [Emiliania huxleyi CCMP1516]|uniref:FDX-ACB domain-containing protein n=2 Tax=Emiliania huxleyi TaxID=2903 RepID=A0A0D3JW60_EMIH1|nr:phenylalanine tRNA synthtetase [Emiliania huxleyi CCMP1516]EOD27745.1 phenylalanine tRNA synthtetase [Emiliania huxleyi CCMP1516]|eukprot:XP_005780174.1 phenylalanine tRNA synthtetase [Emiliania huxleyi CCMP1516]
MYLMLTAVSLAYRTGNNVTPYIANLVGRDLHKTADHPIGIIKQKIEDYFATIDGVKFEIADAMDPLVSAQQCFDDLLIPEDHPGRLPSDTYYVSRPGGREASSSEDLLLRTHTSAHQSTLMRKGYEAFLCTGDVYRRDEIDASHFPAFHQMEGVRLFDPALVGEGEMSREEWLASDGCKLVADDLKRTLEGLCDALFGPVEKRWIDEHGWAFGLGLERLAMVLFEIPDIRLFWTGDERFTSQFKAGQLTKFKPYSKIDLVDSFTHPKKGLTSHCYRITYRSMDRSLTDEEINGLQEELRKQAASTLSVELR